MYKKTRKEILRQFQWFCCLITVYNEFGQDCFSMLGVLESFFGRCRQRSQKSQLNRTKWEAILVEQSPLLTTAKCALNLSAGFLFLFFRRKSIAKQIKPNIFCLSPHHSLEEMTNSFYVIFMTIPFPFPSILFYSLIAILSFCSKLFKLDYHLFIPIFSPCCLQLSLPFYKG